jgi:NADH dehydrogenase FAD-containing subunit
MTVDSQRIQAQVTVWAGGFAVSPVAAASTLAVSGSGQIIVDDTMRSVSHPEVYAVGDAGHAQGPGDKPLRMSCASGVPTAWQAADAIAARLTGRRVPHIAIRYYGQCISLGRRNGLLQFVTADDRATGSQLTDRKAARVKELICTGAAWGATRATSLPARRRHNASVPATV